MLIDSQATGLGMNMLRTGEGLAGGNLRDTRASSFEVTTEFRDEQKGVNSSNCVPFISTCSFEL